MEIEGTKVNVPNQAERIYFDYGEYLNSLINCFKVISSKHIGQMNLVH